MRRITTIVALWLAVITFSVLAQAEITIGVDVSATGPAASLGIENENAILLGPSVIAGQKVRYVILDDGSDATTAVQNVKRLLGEDKIDVLLGPSITPTALAIIDLVTDAKTPTVTFGSAHELVYPVDAKRKWMFKTIANDEVYITVMMDHMLRHGVKTVSVIATNDPYGESWAQGAKRIAAEKGLKILDVERFERTDASTMPQALRVMKGNPDAVLIVAAGTPSVTPHLDLIKLGYKGKIYQSGGAANSEFLRVGGEALDSAYVVQSPFIVAPQLPDGYPIKEPALQFMKLYEAKYGHPASAFAAFAWDSLRLVETAIPVALKKANPGTVEFREALRSALEHLSDVVGVSAIYTLSPTDHTGIDERSMSVIRIVNGGWKLDQLAAAK
jgi:branched-chain amino acid transport system substrate-binding protein